MPTQSKWQIRCLTCSLTRDAEAAGITRIGAYGKKYTLGWCSQCRWLRRAVIEPTPPRGFDVIAVDPQPPAGERQ